MWPRIRRPIGAAGDWSSNGRRISCSIALAHRRLLEHADVFGTRRDPHGIGFPERKRVDGPTRPRTARAAMTIPHGFGFPRDLDLDSPAETFALVRRHRRSLIRLAGRDRLRVHALTITASRYALGTTSVPSSATLSSSSSA